MRSRVETSTNDKTGSSVSRFAAYDGISLIRGNPEYSVCEQGLKGAIARIDHFSHSLYDMALD